MVPCGANHRVVKGTANSYVAVGHVIEDNSVAASQHGDETPLQSFLADYLARTPLSQSLLMSVRGLGEFRGRQALYVEQAPEVLESLLQAALVESAESSNRIEGITVGANRIGPLVLRKAAPQDRSEQEVAGYRDALAAIHAAHARTRLDQRTILGWHHSLYRFTTARGGRWKTQPNDIRENRPDGTVFVRFKPVPPSAVGRYVSGLLREDARVARAGLVEPLLRIAAFVLDFECIHPFLDGNGRVGRLLTLLLLYQEGYEVGRYISLERIVEESKETYYDALYQSSKGWHRRSHDLRPWWNYFLGMLTAAYKEFEERVGKITSARGAKRQMVRAAVERMKGPFTIDDLRRACPGVSYPTLQRALADLRREKRVRCLGRGPRAQWQRVGG